MSINTQKQDGDLLWTELRRAVRLNDLERARTLLQAGANPNMFVQTVDAPQGDTHGHWDSWMQAQCYRGKRCLDLARDMWGQGMDYGPMRALLKSYGAL